MGVNSAHQTLGTPFQKGILYMDQQSSARFLMITWCHGSIGSSKNSVVTRRDDFLDLGAIDRINRLWQSSWKGMQTVPACCLGHAQSHSTSLRASLFLPAAFLRTDFPRFALVDSLMLLGVYFVPYYINLI